MNDKQACWRAEGQLLPLPTIWGAIWLTRLSDWQSYGGEAHLLQAELD